MDKEELISKYESKIAELKAQIEQCYKDKKGDAYYLETQLKAYEDILADLKQEKAE